MMTLSSLKNRFNYNVFVTILAFLLSVILCALELYSFDGRLQKRIIGLNEAWQLNIADSTEINTYPANVQEAYKNLNDFLGFKQNNNIKAWFVRYLNSVYNIDKNFKRKTYPLADRIKSPSAHWNIRSDIHYDDNVYYSKGELLGKIDSAHMSDSSKMVFTEFVEYLQYRLHGLNEPSKISQSSDIEFNRYNKLVLNSIFGAGLKKFTLLDTNIKVYRFFIASNIKDTTGSNKSRINEMMVYPGYAHETFPNLLVNERPWFKAVFDNNNFPLGFNYPDNTYKANFGLTGLYNDVQTKSSTVMDRTFICKFNFPAGSDNEYVACLDLFLQNNYSDVLPFEIKMEDNLGHASLTSLLPFINLSQGVSSLVDAFFLSFFLYFFFRFEWVKKRLIAFFNNLVGENDQQYFMAFDLERENRIPLTENNLNSSVELSYDKTSSSNIENSKDSSFEASYDFKLFKIQFNRGRKQTNNRSYSTKVVLPPLEVKLGVDNKNYYRCIDLWNVTLVNERKEMGTFIVKWLNTIYSADDMSIESSGLLKEMEKSTKDEDRKIVADVKRKFEQMLIKSDYTRFHISIDSRKTPEQITLPTLLKDKRVKGDTLLEYFLKSGQRKRLIERKLFFSYKSQAVDDEYQLFLSLYQNANIYAVCSVVFLENLWDNGRLDSFLNKTGDKERIFIEAAPDEFYKFYEKIITVNEKMFAHLFAAISKKFYIWKFDVESKQGIFKNYDFALVRDYEGNTQYVLFHTPNSTDKEIGWLSWRQVDIDFYNAVYQIIKEEALINKMTLEDYVSHYV